MNWAEYTDLGVNKKMFWTKLKLKSLHYSFSELVSKYLWTVYMAFLYSSVAKPEAVNLSTCSNVCI